jgi:hypothetical protein
VRTQATPCHQGSVLVQLLDYPDARALADEDRKVAAVMG